MEIKTTFPWHTRLDIMDEMNCCQHLCQSTVRLSQLTCMHTSLWETSQCIIRQSAEYKHSLEVCYVSMAIASSCTMIQYLTLNTRNYVEPGM